MNRQSNINFDVAANNMPSRLEKIIFGIVKQSKGVVPTLVLLGLAVSGWWAIHHWTSEEQTKLDQHDESIVTQENLDPEYSNPTIVSLPPGKIDASNLESVSAQSQVIEHVHLVPGRIRYDETKHIEVKSPMDGILQEFSVTPGAHVEDGQLLAILKSPQIGQARSEVIKRRQELEIARQLLERERLVAVSLTELLESLKNQASEPASEDTSSPPLGIYRQEILASHAKLELARDLLSKVRPLGDSGAISGRTIREREAELQIAQSIFQTACDQSLFNSQQAKLAAEAKFAEAERQVNLAWQAVDELLGYQVGYQADRSSPDLSQENALSRLEIRAPFAGTIESRGFANNERVMRGDSLAVLANTSSLYVSASIRESDWPAIRISPGTVIQVQVPALENRFFDATVRFIGRELHSDSNAIPLVAAIDNDQGLLRPGMFVRVSLPMGQATEGLSVKPESVVQHDNQSFVFVELSQGKFQRVDVRTGHSSPDWIEITEGLSPGQLVVSNGAFLLKSELLLQGE